MATKRTSKPKSAAEATVEAPAATETMAPECEQRSEQVAAAQAMLDTIRQNAMATRDPLYWGQYRGAREMARCLGYTVTVVGERAHILTETS